MKASDWFAERTTEDQITILEAARVGMRQLRVREDMDLSDVECARVIAMLLFFLGDTCQHEAHEDCMHCCVCGECREDLDENDYCPNCQDNPSIMECVCGEVFHIGEDGEWDEWNNHAQNCNLWMPDLS